MSDLNYINSIIGPANRAVSDTRRFINQFQAQQATQQQNMGGSGYVGPSPDVMAASQAMYIQSMMVQMNQMSWMLGQFSGMFSTILNNSNINLEELGLDEDLLKQMLQMMGGYPGDGDSNGSGSSSGTSSGNPALPFLSQFLKQESHESNVEDTDEDGYVVGEGDVDRIMEAIDDEEFTSADLTKAFQYLLAKGNTDKLDELLDLFSMVEEKGLVNSRSLFKSKFVEKLSNSRIEVLAGYLAEEGLVDEDGDANTALATSLLNGLSNNAPDKIKHYSQSTIRALVDRWMVDSVPADDPDRKQLVNLLSLAGFKFNADGTLAPDDEQPFSLSPEEEDDEDA